MAKKGRHGLLGPLENLGFPPAGEAPADPGQEMLSLQEAYITVLQAANRNNNAALERAVGILARQKGEKQTGGILRHRNTPAHAAKVAADGLWPRANREGWTAVKMHARLTAAGHEVSPGTVQKWMARLRKGERLVEVDSASRS